MGGAKAVRMRLQGEKTNLLELAANHGSWHASPPLSPSSTGTYAHADHFDEAAAEELSKDLPLLCQPKDEEIFSSDGFSDVPYASL